MKSAKVEGSRLIFLTTWGYFAVHAGLVDQALKIRAEVFWSRRSSWHSSDKFASSACERVWTVCCRALFVLDKSGRPLVAACPQSAALRSYYSFRPQPNCCTWNAGLHWGASCHRTDLLPISSVIICGQQSTRHVRKLKGMNGYSRCALDFLHFRFGRMSRVICSRKRRDSL